MKIGVFPGSFDPFTKGHESVVLTALNFFDEVIIAIGVNSKKTSYFTLEKRKKHIESLFTNRVQVLEEDCGIQKTLSMRNQLLL